MAAVREHEVVAVRVGDADGRIEIIRWRDGAPAVERHTVRGLHGWVRAGRITVATAEGARFELTLLGAREAGPARLGDHWPPHDRPGRLGGLGASAAHQFGAVVRLDRCTRTSGERNDAVAALVARVRRAVPDVAVGYGSPFGHDRWEPQVAQGLVRKGLLGRHGDTPEL